ncbi:MAG: TauD/TfdA dioxygenase family protein [Acidimicrobiia bacterium]
MFELTPITGRFGAEVRGLDLAEELTEEALQKIKEAFLSHKVLVFRDQHNLTPERHARLGRYFGDLEVHPFQDHVDGIPEVTVLRTDLNPTESERNEAIFHSDTSWRATPSLGSILRAIDVPPFGRDTTFTDTEAIFDDMSPPLQRLCTELTAMHDVQKQSGFRGKGGSDDFPPVEHPVVRTHPETGRRSLFVNPSFTTRLVGLRSDESDPILQALFARLFQPQYQLRCRWHPGTVAMWDNRCTQHAVVFDRAYPRTMQRVTIVGDRPF